MFELRGSGTVRLMRMPTECFVQGFVRLSNGDTCEVVVFALSVGVLLLRRTHDIFSPGSSHRGDAHRGCQSLEASFEVWPFYAQAWQD